MTKPIAPANEPKLPLTVCYEDLKPILGIQYSRPHLERFQDKDDPCYDPTFPKSIAFNKKAKSRRFWWTHDLIAWLKSKVMDD